MVTQDFRSQLVALEPSLLRFARSLTTNADDARDLLQETSLRALTFQDSYRDNTNLKAWAFTIMRNTFINSYRRLSRRSTTFDDTDDQRLLNSRESAETADANLGYTEVAGAIDALAPSFRLPLLMHSAGFKYREIADELDLCIGTVKSRIFFSRRRLASQLQGYAL